MTIAQHYRDRGDCENNFAEGSKIAKILNTVSQFLQGIKSAAEQLAQDDTWSLILSAAFRHFLGGKVLGSPGRLAQAIG